MNQVTCGALLGLVLLITSCGERNDGPGTLRTVRSTARGVVEPPKPSEASLAEARQMDEIQALMDDGRYDKARAKLTELVDGGCHHPQAFFLQGQLHYQQGELESAIPWFERAIAGSSYWVEPRVALAQSYIRLKRLAAAESVFKDIDRLAPEVAWGPYGMGAITLMRGDFARATPLIDEALRRNPRHAQSLRLRANLAERARDQDLEERLLGRYLTEDPGAAWAYVRLGELATNVSRLTEAEHLFLRAYELEPLSSTARRLAELAQRRDDTVAARRWQEKAGILQPTPVQADAP